jgi:hypothetical protein
MGVQGRRMALRPSGHRWTIFTQLVLRTYGDGCWCGHGGARQVDHLEPVADRPDLAWTLANCRPAHGAPGNPCPVCSKACGRKIHCNQLRGPMSIDRARRLIAEMAEAYARGDPLPEPSGTGYAAERARRQAAGRAARPAPARARHDDDDTGREW